MAPSQNLNADKKLLTYDESFHGSEGKNDASYILRSLMKDTLAGAVATGFPGVVSGVEQPFQEVQLLSFVFCYLSVACS